MFGELAGPAAGLPCSPRSRRDSQDFTGVTPKFTEQLKDDLKSLSNKKLYRSLRLQPSGVIDFSSNDYLGFSHEPAVLKASRAAVSKWGSGSTASRLLSGNLGIHEELEQALALFKKEEAVLSFSSGYMANLGAVTSLVDGRDVVLLDRLNHASLVDASRLSGAKLWVYPHLDLARLRDLLKRAGGFRRRLVVTDAYFSMDGHVAPLDELLAVCEEQDAILMIDEAHSTGVYGKAGRGLSERYGLSGKIPVVMGTLSKALGSSGGYVAGSRALIETLVNQAKSFIYTTAPVPAASAAALAAIRILEKTESPVGRLWERVHQMRDGLLAMGLDLMDSDGPIIPIQVRDSARALQIREKLQRKGFFVAAIRPPTVPKGTDRIRLSISAKHSKLDIESFLKAFRQIQKKGL